MPAPKRELTRAQLWALTRLVDQELMKQIALARIHATTGRVDMAARCEAAAEELRTLLAILEEW